MYIGLLTIILTIIIMLYSTHTQLYTNTCAKTCANFKALCTGEKGVSETTGVRLSYTNTLIHRVVLGGWIQGGDIVDGSGNGGESISGGMQSHH